MATGRGEDILKWTDGEEERYLWIYALKHSFEQIENRLKDKNIFLSPPFEGKYFARFEKAIEGKLIISKILAKNTAFLDVFFSKNCPKDFKGYDVEVFTYRNNGCYIVGTKESVARAKHYLDDNDGDDVKEYDQKNRRNSDDVGDFVNLELITLNFTPEETASIFLCKLWETAAFKSKAVNITIDEQIYSIRISFEKNAESAKIENDIKFELKRVRNDFLHSELSLDASEIEFLKTDAVSRRMDQKLNRNKARCIDCVWFVDERRNIVNLYSGCYHTWIKETIRKFIVNGRQKMPEILQASPFVEKKLAIIKEKYSNLVKLRYDPAIYELTYICFRDDEFEIKTELETLIERRSITVKKENCGIFQEVVKDITEKYNVIMTENTSCGSSSWVIEGLSGSSVQNAYDEIKMAADNIQKVEKCYQTDEKPETLKNLISRLTEHGVQITTKENEFNRAAQPIDLRKTVESHTWKLPNGCDFKLTNTAASWLIKDHIILCFADENDNPAPPKVLSVNNSQPSITMYIPKWTGGGNKEKDTFDSALDEVLNDKILQSAISGKVSLAIHLSGAEKLKWPKKKFLNGVLSSFKRNINTLAIHFLEPSKKDFEQASSRIQDFVDSLYDTPRINIHIEAGEIALLKYDAIVNSANESLDLNCGAVSKSIYKIAGEEIQEECKRKLPVGKKLSSTEVVVTNGYKLKSRYVFHGALASRWYDQTLGRFVNECLKLAEERNLTNIAFPALGTGNLGYPANEVAKVMFNTVREYTSKNQSGSLKIVTFVIYPRDTKAMQAFQEEERRRREAPKMKKDLLKCTTPKLVKIEVIGENSKTVNQVVSRFEEELRNPGKHENPLEPEHQEIHRSLEDEEEVQEFKNVEKWLGKSNTSQTDTFRQPTSNGGENENPDVPVYVSNWNVNVESRTKHHINYSDLVEEINSFVDVNELAVFWCPLIPKEAKVKLQRQSDAERFVEKMRGSQKYTAHHCDIEAVVNIRAKLTDSMCKLASSEQNCQRIEQESGVKVVQDDYGKYVITGSLSEITVARLILIELKKNMSTSMSSPVHFVQGKETTTKSSVVDATEKSTLTSSSSIKTHTKGNISMLYPDLSDADKWECSQQNPETSKGSFKGKNDLFSGEENDQTTDGKVGTRKRYTQQTSVDIENQSTATSEQEMMSHTPDNASLVMKTNEGVSVYVYQGNMCFLQTDCIVNSSSEQMSHTSGLSKVIADHAGDTVQIECSKYLKENKRLTPHNTCVTGAGNLKYNFIVHVCSPAWDKKKSTDEFLEDLQRVVKLSLIDANDKHARSVGIPAIGSGGRGGPTQLCFPKYVDGIIAFSKEYGKKSSVKEVHFVDRDFEVVRDIQTSFLLAVPEPDEGIVKKISKIPAKILEKFDSYAKKHDKEIKTVDIPVGKGLSVVMCDGTLFKSYRHSHLKDLSSNLTTTAVAIPDNIKLESKSRVAALALQKGGKNFRQHYDTLSSQKKCIGKVKCISGDTVLNFDYACYVFMPNLNDECKRQASTQQKSFFKKIEECYRSLFEAAHAKGINHLCMPVLTEEYYESPGSWFTKENAAILAKCILSFEKKDKKSFLIHVVIKNENDMKMLKFILDCEKRQTSDKPGQNSRDYTAI